MKACCDESWAFSFDVSTLHAKLAMARDGCRDVLKSSKHDMPLHACV